jgi:hypothetical protein
MKDAWDKYERKITNTGNRIRFWKEENKTLPCMTLCPMPAFKKKGFFYSEKLMRENSYTLEDVFSKETVTAFNDISKFTIKNTSSQLLGHCFTLCYRTPFPPKLSNMVFGIKQNFDLKIYVHQNNTDFWITSSKEFPVNVPSSVLIESNNSKGLRGAFLDIAEVETTYLSKDEKECKPAMDEATNYFVQCSKETLWKNLPSAINCTIVDMMHIVPKNSTMIECSDDISAEFVYFNYSRFLTEFIMKPEKFGCPVPCKQTIFKINSEYVHNNNLKYPSDYPFLDKSFLFRLQYSTLNVEEQIENLDYDLASLLVASGGNLGLFIGFSCLSVVFQIINFVHSFYK